MGIFDLKGGSSSGWNYADSSKPGYSETLVGTVVEISNPQKLNYSTKQPEFWQDGNPKRVLRVTILTDEGQEKGWVFAPKSKAADACLLALDPQGMRQSVSIEELLGKRITVQTQGGVFNAQNPRPWWVTVQGEGNKQAVRGLVDLSQTAQAPVQPQPAPAPVQPMQYTPAQQRAAEALGYADPTGGLYDADMPF